MASILLVDDDRVQAMTRKLILEQTGHQVEVTHAAPSAVRLLRGAEAGGGFHLIVTDHLMPEMNGPEFVGEIRKIDVSLPILVLSGLPSAEPEYDGLNVVFRVKPLAPPDLIALAGDLIAERLRRSA